MKQEREDRLASVLKKAREAGMKSNKRKCEFGENVKQAEAKNSTQNANSDKLFKGYIFNKGYKR